MKNNFSKKVLENIYEKYQILKKDSEYCSLYLSLMLFDETCCLNEYMLAIIDNLFKNEPVPDDFPVTFDEIAEARHELTSVITKKFGLLIPISPDLKIKKKAIFNLTIRPNAPLAKLIFAYGLSVDPRLLEFKIPKKGVSRKTKELDLQSKVVLLYVLYTSVFKGTDKASYSFLGRIFDLHHSTVKKWIERFKSLSPADRDLFISEVLTRKRFPNVEALDLHPSYLRVFNKVANKIDSQGKVIDTHRKPKSKPSY